MSRAHGILFHRKMNFKKLTNERWGEKLCVTKKKLFIPQHSKKMNKRILPPRAAIAALLLD